MFEKVGDADFVRAEHRILKFWTEARVFDRLREQNRGGQRWSFLDGPITANNPMGVHHAWGRTYKDAYQRFHAMRGCELRYQNGFDCQGLWVEVEVEKELNLGTKTAINEFGVDRFVNECKKRVLRFAARQTEQSIRLGYWCDWDDPEALRLLAETVGSDQDVTIVTPTGQSVTDKAHNIVAKLGSPEWGGSYFTFSTENNETIWTFLKKCFNRGKIYRGYDVMPWSGRAGSAYSQMEVADGRKLTVHKSCFVRFPLKGRGSRVEGREPEAEGGDEYLLVWTTTPWTLTSNVACAVNPDLDYVKLQTKRDGAIYYFAKDNLDYKRLDREFKEGFGGADWKWPKDVPKLKTIAQIFKEQGGYEVLGTIKGAEMVGWQYEGPFDALAAQQAPGPDVGERTAAVDAVIDSYRRDWDAYLVRHEEADHCPLDNRPTLLRWMSDFCRAACRLGWLGSNPFDGQSVLMNQYDLWVRGLGLSQQVASLADQVAKVEAAHLAVTAARNWDDETQREIAAEQRQVVATCLSDWTSVADGKHFDEPVFLREMAEKELRLLEEVRDELRVGVKRSAAESHYVISGGRDSKGNPNVVAGEGTGIVHIAPGCGDIDHVLGGGHQKPVIAPLSEDGTFGEGFGPFTGKEAIHPDTAQLVFDSLKDNHKLVYVEQYPHIYPHCWRTGDELVFRLVDEWFINMDWRDEIKDVTRAINWLPASIDGQDREIEWLTNMRDWMISKKRFWGLALPIWINPDDPADFEVIGSLAELKERAVEGWDEFAGNTPHRPWIDRVKIKSERTGATLSRIVDVGNPWLDAGIVPFSTMHYNTDRDEWAKWFPADFVTECFPGQFRNWFYSLLSLATMMRHDETDDPLEKRPFKNLLGHRLVMDEHGQAMHKSDGTAIWFEEAAEQLGVDTLRWLYLAHNPAQDLRFGTRHPDEPVELETPEGTISATKEGLPTCRVTSTPADEVRRQVLIPLWNSYAFFVNYAILDEFDPRHEQMPVAERPEIDRWILSNLQSLIETSNREFAAFNAPEVCRASAAFIDDLSNWYIRRNRRRFWRSRDAGDTDKLAAYQTLHEVLLTLTKLLAPAIPFLAERMYQNLADADTQSGAPHSVHLCPYPSPSSELLDPDLNRRMSVAQTVVRLGHKLREEASLRVRQPLAELRFSADDSQTGAIEQLADVIREELNVKAVVPADNLDELVSYSFKPNLKTLGPKYGKLLVAIRNGLPNVAAETLAPLQRGESVTVEFDGAPVQLEPDDVLISVEQAAGWVCGSDAGLQMALSTELSPELIAEGVRNDFIRHVQQARKDADLEIQDRITIGWHTASDEVAAAIEQHADYIRGETLADAMHRVDAPPNGGRQVSVGEANVAIVIARA